jgi:hypothetical protein
VSDVAPPPGIFGLTNVGYSGVVGLKIADVYTPIVNQTPFTGYQNNILQSKNPTYVGYILPAVSDVAPPPGIFGLTNVPSVFTGVIPLKNTAIFDHFDSPISIYPAGSVQYSPYNIPLKYTSATAVLVANVPSISAISISMYKYTGIIPVKIVDVYTPIVNQTPYIGNYQGNPIPIPINSFTGIIPSQVSDLVIPLGSYYTSQFVVPTNFSGVPNSGSINIQQTTQTYSYWS